MIPFVIIAAQELLSLLDHCFVPAFSCFFMPCLLSSIGSSEEYIQDELILIPIYMFPPDLITYYTQMQTRMQQIANEWYRFWQ